MSSETRMCRTNRTAKARPKLPDVVTQIVARSDPARVVELYYWSQEPGLLEIIRAISAMPEAGREALESFFALVGDAQSVVATWESTGRLSLESRALGETLAVAKYFLEGPGGAGWESEPN